MISIRLVIVKCPECGAKLLAVKGEDVCCERENCTGFVKHAYSDEEFVIAVGGKKGLLVAPVMKQVGEG
jgi:hypothetical protein